MCVFVFPVSNNQTNTQPIPFGLSRTHTHIHTHTCPCPNKHMKFTLKLTKSIKNIVLISRK